MCMKIAYLGTLFKKKKKITYCKVCGALYMRVWEKQKGYLLIYL